MAKATIAAAFCAALAGMAFSAPSHAATASELDALARASAQPATGVALARRQIAAGELLEALATLERVILGHPDNNEARLLHAGVMCRLDDRSGAMVEMDGIRGRPISDALWQEANAACSSKREG